MCNSTHLVLMISLTMKCNFLYKNIGSLEFDLIKCEITAIIWGIFLTNLKVQ